MKKIIPAIIGLTLLFGLTATAFAATATTYSPSMALTEFEKNYGTAYDRINDNLHQALSMATKWAPDAALHTFSVSWQPQQNDTYYFDFGSLSNTTEHYKVTVAAGNQLSGQIIKYADGEYLKEY